MEISVCEAKKTNGILRRGLRFSKKGTFISPTIYLEEYYERFCSGCPIEQITKEIIDMYDNVKLQHSWDRENIFDYPWIRDRIVFRVVGREANGEMLKSIPHQEHLDLAIVYYVLFEIGEWTTATMLIGKEHLEMWHVQEDEIRARAEENTPILLPEEMYAMSELLGETGGKAAPLSKEKMYVLTNRLRSYGASAIFYPDCLEKIGRFLKQGFFIIPSSVHEVIILKESTQRELEENKVYLSGLVREINATHVHPEEVLSNRVYYYDPETRSLA